MSPLEAHVALNMLPGIGPIRCRRLIDAFGCADSVLKAGTDAWRSVKGIGPDLARTLANWQNHADPHAEIRECRERGIHIITPQDEAYPALLKETYDAPIVLYCYGELKALDHEALGIVGSRRCSHYGLQATRKFAYQLASSGQTIVSGLARGIDTAAHEAAIAANGRTVAIIGSGLAQLYPPENQALADRIADGHGAVISEYPIHTRPDKGTFPMRNRIIAGWSQATLAIECPDRSGALITANLAGEYGRPVFAVPGPIDRATFAGSHRLIRDGATLVTDAAHVIEDLGGIHLPQTAPQSDSKALHDRPISGLTPEQAEVLSHLGSEEITADQLIDICKLSAATITSCLSLLEILGFIRSLPGSRYVKTVDA